MKVIVADDDPLSRKYIESLLEAGGHSYESYEDGKHAWEAITREGSPQLILLDWIMPEMDGMEICQRMANLPSRHEKYILVLSGIQDKNDIAQMLSAGADDYMTKPIHEYEFLARVQVAERMVGFINGLNRRNRELANIVRRYTQMAELEGKRHLPDENAEAPAMSLPEAPEVPAFDDTNATASSASEAVETEAGVSGDGEARTVAPVDFFEEEPEPVEEVSKSFVPEPLLEPIGNLRGTQLYPEIVRSIFTGFNLDTEIAETPHAFDEALYVSWASLYMIKHEMWCDLLLEFPETSADALAQMLLDTPAEDIEQNRVDVAAQLVNLVQGAFRSQLNRDLMASQVTYAPGAVRIEAGQEYKHACVNMEGCGYSVCGYLGNAWMASQQAPRMNKPIDLLKPFYVLPEPLKSTTNPPVIVAKKWTVLNDESIRSLQSLVEARKIDSYVIIIQPSALYESLYEHMSAGW